MKDDKLRILLKNDEQFYLRLYLLGMRDSGIKKFLKISLPELLQIKNQLISKFNTDDLNEILNKSINSGLINTNDYIINAVKQDALYYADLIFEIYFEGKETNTSEEVLKQELLRFLEMNEKRIKN
jgi:hypothetical protein